MSESILMTIKFILRQLNQPLDIEEIYRRVSGGGASMSKLEFQTSFNVLSRTRPPLVVLVPGNGNGALWRRTDRGARLVGWKSESRTIPIDISEEETEISAAPIISAPLSDPRFGTMENLWQQTP